jgi:hypothetical protein
MPTQTWSCPFRKLNPTVLMVKSPQDVASDDAAAALNGSAMWGIFLQADSSAETLDGKTGLAYPV